MKPAQTFYHRVSEFSPLGFFWKEGLITPAVCAEKKVNM